MRYLLLRGFFSSSSSSSSCFPLCIFILLIAQSVAHLGTSNWSRTGTVQTFGVSFRFSLSFLWLKEKLAELLSLTSVQYLRAFPQDERASIRNPESIRSVGEVWRWSPPHQRRQRSVFPRNERYPDGISPAILLCICDSVTGFLKSGQWGHGKRALRSCLPHDGTWWDCIISCERVKPKYWAMLRYNFSSPPSFLFLLLSSGSFRCSSMIELNYISLLLLEENKISGSRGERRGWLWCSYNSWMERSDGLAS